MPRPVLRIDADTISSDIEEAARGYYERLFNREPYHFLSVGEMLMILKRFRNSAIERERKVFRCVLKMIFDEQVFLNSYSENKIKILAQLFGSFIKHGFFSDYEVLDAALRTVFVALKTSPLSNKYLFGITALDHFKCRLKDLRHYCIEIIKIPHSNQFPRHLIEYLEWGRNSLQLPPSRVAYLDRVFPNSTSNNDFESVDTIIEPAINVQIKIIDVINEMNLCTMEAKGREIKRILARRYLPWFAQYLVTRRIPIEKVFHELYRNFLRHLNCEYLNELVLSETYKNIKLVLKSYSETADNCDRLTLENLGYWLGVITIQNNISIPLDDLDLKMLFIDALKKGHQQLFGIVKFITTILESCKWSEEITPSHPWARSMINYLGELFLKPNLDLFIKYEIELLYRHLNIEIKALKPALNIIHQDYSKIAKILNQRLLANNAVLLNRDHQSFQNYQ